MSEKEQQLKRLTVLLPKLEDSQLRWIERIAQQFQRPHRFDLNSESDIVDDCLLAEVGDTLRLHHCFSHESFSKDKFEYAMESAARACGREAELASRGNPGHDVTIAKVRYSLKTQADKSIKQNYIHISKFMELGRGDWESEADLETLRDQFLRHMQGYERILTLRTLKRAPYWFYELVEIPKDVLERAAEGTISMVHNSRQNPKPGYCRIIQDGELWFELYFDGGTERKLQIKKLDKELCIVHATWQFSVEDVIEEEAELSVERQTGLFPS